MKRLVEELQSHSLPPAKIGCKDAVISTHMTSAAIPTQQDLHINYDNVSAIKLAKNPIFHARTKHLEIHHHFIRERVLAGEISVHHVSTHEQPADIFTKSLSRIKFEEHRKKIGMKTVEEMQVLHAHSFKT